MNLPNETLTCPEASEDYDPRERHTRQMAEHHRIKTETQVVLRHGEPALKITATCVCGWAGTTVLTGEGND